ncbi:Protein yippee-like 4, partial [Galemys pyrenaicus]
GCQMDPSKGELVGKVGSRHEKWTLRRTRVLPPEPNVTLVPARGVFPGPSQEMRTEIEDGLSQGVLSQDQDKLVESSRHGFWAGDGLRPGQDWAMACQRFSVPKEAPRKFYFPEAQQSFEAGGHRLCQRDALSGKWQRLLPPQEANLLRCFTCDRLCGGCTAPAPPARQGIVLQPVMPSCDPGPGPACLPTKTFRSYLPRCHRTYSCVHCRAHLAKHDELISKVGQAEACHSCLLSPTRTAQTSPGGEAKKPVLLSPCPWGVQASFQGSHGRAYLFNSVVNVGCGPAEQRLLLTGLHSVADIFCESCKTTLGWKYEQAFETSQKYKEGKYIIEMSHMVKDNGWD